MAHIGYIHANYSTATTAPHSPLKQNITMEKVHAKWEDCIYCKEFPLAPPFCIRLPPKGNLHDGFHYPDCKMCMGKKCKYFTTKNNKK